MTATTEIVLETERLVLRRWRDPDARVLHEDVLGDPEVMEFSSGPRSLEEVHDWIERKRTAMEESGHTHWATEEKASGRLIGFCGLARQRLPEGVFPEVGYRLARASWGRGLATEAARAAVGWARTNTDWPRVIAIIEPANGRSVRVAEKLGMRLDHRSRFHGKAVDVYAIELADRRREASS